MNKIFVEFESLYKIEKQRSPINDAAAQCLLDLNCRLEVIEQRRSYVTPPQDDTTLFDEIVSENSGKDSFWYLTNDSESDMKLTDGTILKPGQRVGRPSNIDFVRTHRPAIPAGDIPKNPSNLDTSAEHNQKREESILITPELLKERGWLWKYDWMEHLSKGTLSIANSGSPAYVGWNEYDEKTKVKLSTLADLIEFEGEQNKDEQPVIDDKYPFCFGIAGPQDTMFDGMAICGICKGTGKRLSPQASKGWKDLCQWSEKKRVDQLAEIADLKEQVKDWQRRYWIHVDSGNELHERMIDMKDEHKAEIAGLKQAGEEVGFEVERLEKENKNLKEQLATKFPTDQEAQAWIQQQFLRNVTARAAADQTIQWIRDRRQQ